MLHGSASAPSLALQREPQGYAHSERVTRKVPPLALLPLDQLQQQREKEEQKKKNDEGQQGRNPVHRRRQRRAEEEEGAQERDEQQQRLGERFLGMMALLARLKRMDLDDGSSPKERTARRSPLRSSRSTTAPLQQQKEDPKPSAYELLVQKKKAERSRGVALAVATDAVGASSLELSPHRKPEPVVNVATAPLREHLTFEISMLLPQPIDTRQSALESPIRRKKRRRRRRKKRLLGATFVDGKRTWTSSHVTWVPHASADYAKARTQEAVAAQGSSKLVAKFAALKTAATADASGGRAEEHWRRDPYAKTREERRLNTKSAKQTQQGMRCEDEEEEESDDRGETQDRGLEEIEEEEAELSTGADSSEEDTERDDEEQEKAEEEEEEEDALPELLQPHASTSMLPSSERPPLRKPPTVSVIRPVQTHQAAWISPELRRWLVSSGLFRTATKSPSSASC